MKKVLIIAAAALFIGSAANAQDVLKQTGGEQNLEVLFSPFGGSPIGINGIKYRSFTSATSAFRATVFLGLTSETDKTLGGGEERDEELKTTETSFNISIRPGIEKHFVGTDRLSPYYGAEAIIGFGRTSVNEDEVYDFVEGDFETLTTSSQGTLSLGVNGIAGMDFYFADNIYFGAELGFGILYTINMKETVESFEVDEFETPSGDIESEEIPGGSSIEIGPNVVGAIRLGFLF